MYSNVNLSPSPAQGLNVDYQNARASFSSNLLLNFQTYLSLKPRSTLYLISNQNLDSADQPIPEDSGSVQPLWRNNVQGDYLDADIGALNTTHLIGWSYQIAQGMAYLAQKKVT